METYFAVLGALVTVELIKDYRQWKKDKFFLEKIVPEMEKMLKKGDKNENRSKTRRNSK